MATDSNNLYKYRFNQKYPDKDCPSNIGKKWTTEEENLLLEYLEKNINIDVIAEKHQRTSGSIYSRQKIIAFNMHKKNMPIKEIINKTKLIEEEIKQFIENKSIAASIKSNQKNITKSSNIFSIENKILEIKTDISEIKIDMKDLKNILNELVEMMKAAYDFEDV